MHKPIVALILGFFIFCTVKAQDTILYHVKYIRPDLEDVVRVVSKDSADFDLYITHVPGSRPEDEQRIFKEVYINTNTPKMTGTAKFILDGRYANLFFEGTVTEYYRNGNTENIINYEKGTPVGLLSSYFPNGNLYTIKKYRKVNDIKYRESFFFYLLECHDTTGKILAQNGNGTWQKLDKDMRHIIEEGQVVNGLEEGEWRGYINDTVMYYPNYHKGKVLPTSDTTGQIYYSAEREPEFNANNTTFQHFLGQSILYPASARAQQIRGRVYVTFVVEKDGSLTNVKAIRGPDQSLKDEAERCVKLSPPWAPAFINHKPVRFQYTVPVNFNLED